MKHVAINILFLIAWNYASSYIRSRCAQKCTQCVTKKNVYYVWPIL